MTGGGLGDRVRRCAFVLAMLFALAWLAPTTALAIPVGPIFPTTTADDPSANQCSPLPLDDKNCSLREALLSGDGVTVELSPSLHGPYVITQSTSLQINHNVRLVGLGADQSTIEGNGTAPVIEIGSTATDARISGVKIAGGGTGGVINDGTLTLENSVISGNLGGGIANGLPLLLPGTLTVIGSAITDNLPGSSGGGGGIVSAGTTTILNSTIAGNQVQGNDATGGGILVFSGSLNLANVTLSDNTATGIGAGGGNLGATSGIQVHAKNTIIAGGTAAGSPSNCSLAIVSLGHNIEDGNSCGLNGPGDQPNTNPMLGPLQDNGGPTPTQAPALDGPAVDHGDPAGCTDFASQPLSSDQRGQPRPQGLACDVGAYELQPVAPSLSLGTPSAVSARAATLTGAVDTHGFQTTWHFEYGTTTAYGSSTPDQVLTGGHPAASAAISGLNPATTYHYRLVASTPGGQTKTSDMSFTTLGDAPDVVNGPAVAVSSTRATLTGMVTANGLSTTYQFFYGPTSSYGSATAMQAAGSGNLAVPASVRVGGLKPNTTYHYELIASNSAGSRIGADRTFITSAPPSLSALVVAPGSFAAAASGASTARHRRRHRAGATVSYRDTEAAVTTFVVEKIGKRHRVHVIGSFTHQDQPGANSFHFTGRLAGAALAAGTYTLVATATDADGVRSLPVSTRFQIVRSRVRATRGG